MPTWPTTSRSWPSTTWSDPTRSIRYYDEAAAAIKVDKGGEKPTLEARRRLIVAEKPGKSAPVLFCPASPLSREELDLIEVPGNTLLVDRLLPDEPVAVGDSWPLDKQSLADLLGIDGVSTSDVKATLAEVAAGLADVAASGSLIGAVGGVSTEIELKVRYKFDLEQKRIVHFALLIKEKRSVGHVGPGLDTVAKVLVKISPISGSENLTAEAVASLPPAAAPENLRLRYTAAGGQFGFLHDRRWYLTTEDPKLAVFRLVDQGELIAQCNISSVLAAPKKALTLAEFQRDVQQSLGKNFGQFVSAGQSTTEAGYTVFRVVVQGNVSKLPIEWIYYLVGDAQGNRVSLAFTLEESLKERFAEADRALAGGMRLAQAKPKASTVAKPPVTKPSLTK